MQTLDKITKLFEELNALKPIKAEWQEKLDKKFRLEFNYNSNHLEGNTLTYGETELLLIFDDTKGNHTMREYEEMKAHDVAYQLVEDWAKDSERPLTEQNIKNLNQIILVRPFWKDAITADGQNTRRQIEIGNYKTYSNSVRLQNGEIFHYASPTETPIQMQEMIEWYRKSENELHPVVLAAMLHYKFVCIHPFDDGNGRVSRLLMNYVLVKNHFPPTIIQSSDKNNYLRALHLADVGDIQPFIDYIAEQVIWSLQMSIKAAKGEDLEEDDDLDKEIALLNRQIKFQSKTPGNLYYIFMWFEKNIGKAIRQSLTKFNDLFKERHDHYHVFFNPRTQENFLTADPYHFSTDIDTLKKNDPYIYNDNIQRIEWIVRFYRLIGSIKLNEVKIKIELQFTVDYYDLTISIGFGGIFDENVITAQCKYGKFIDQNEIKRFQRAAANKVLESLKNKINNE